MNQMGRDRESLTDDELDALEKKIDKQSESLREVLADDLDADPIEEMSPSDGEEDE